MQHVCNTTFVIDIYTRFALTQWRLALDKALSLLSRILSPYRCAFKRSDGAYLGHQTSLRPNRRPHGCSKILLCQLRMKLGKMKRSPR